MGEALWEASIHLRGEPIPTPMAESGTTKHEKRMVASRTGILPVQRPCVSRCPVKYAFHRDAVGLSGYLWEHPIR